MNLIEQTKKTYIRKDRLWDNRKKKAQDKIEKLNEQIKEQEKIIESWYDKSPSWTEELVRPLIDEIERQTGLVHKDHLDPKDLKWSRRHTLIPHGLKSHVHVFFYKKLKNGKRSKKVSGMLVFVPTRLEQGEILLETLHKFDPKAPTKNTLHDMNGFNFIDIPMPKDIKTLIECMKNGNCKYIREQVKKVRDSRNE